MKVGFTCSTFDLLHAGHIAMLREAKSNCEYLICGLQVDPSVDRTNKNAPIQSVVERYKQLSAVKYVNEIEHGFKGESKFSYILFKPNQFKLSSSAKFDAEDPDRLL